MAKLAQALSNLKSHSKGLELLLLLEIDESNEESLVNAHDQIYIGLRRFNAVAIKISQYYSSKKLDKELEFHKEFVTHVNDKVNRKLEFIEKLGLNFGEDNPFKEFLTSDSRSIVPNNSFTSQIAISHDQALSSYSLVSPVTSSTTTAINSTTTTAAAANTSTTISKTS